jgi:hypothetical protein
MNVFLVNFEVLGQLANPEGQQSDLDLGTTGIHGRALELLNNLLFLVLE